MEFYLAQATLVVIVHILIAPGRCTGTNATDRNVSAHEGDTITLRCRTDKMNTPIYWKLFRGSSTHFDAISSSQGVDPSFSATHNVTFNNATRESTLVIRSVQRNDAGTYVCSEQYANEGVEFQLRVVPYRTTTTACTTTDYVRRDSTSSGDVPDNASTGSRNASDETNTETVGLRPTMTTTETTTTSTPAKTTTGNVRESPTYANDDIIDDVISGGRSHRKMPSTSVTSIPYHSMHVTVGLAALLTFCVIVLLVLVILTLRKYHWNIIRFISGVKGRKGANEFTTLVVDQDQSPVCVIQNNGFDHWMFDDTKTESENAEETSQSCMYGGCSSDALNSIYTE